MTPTMNPNLRDFWSKPSRYKVLYGGRSSGKSWDAAANAIRIANHCKIKVLCTRQFQNKIEESVYSLLKIQIERFSLRDRFTVLNNKIICKATESEFLFYGIQRNLDEIKSIESVDVLWIEEAHALSQEQYEILEPTIRKEGSEIWIVFNPNLLADFVYQRFVTRPPPNAITREFNYTENPFLSETIKSVIENAKDEDYESYEHIYLGKPKANDDSSIIKLKWIHAAIDAHKKLGIEPSGIKAVGFDIADDGGDTCATIYRHGAIAYELDEWRADEDELLKSCGRTYGLARDKDAAIVYDCIGVGASAGAKFKEINESRSDEQGFREIKYRKFNAGSRDLYSPERDYSEGIKNKDKFSNLKAQAWWLLADRFRNTYNAVVNGHEFSDDEIISIDSGMDKIQQLSLELTTPLKDVDNNGRDKVESKKDLKKRGVDSPNLADAMVMAFAPVNAGSAVSVFTRKKRR